MLDSAGGHMFFQLERGLDCVFRIQADRSQSGNIRRTDISAPCSSNHATVTEIGSRVHFRGNMDIDPEAVVLPQPSRT